MLKHIKNLNKKWLILIAVLLLIVIIVIATKAYLYFNCLSGNDTIVKLEADKEFLSLQHKQNTTIEFQASVTANPFCSISCQSVFTDISNNQILEQDSFTIKTASPISKSYTIIPPEKGIGNKLYRFDMKCSSQKTFLCSTEGQLATRSQLIILEYNLTEQETQKYKEFESNLLSKAKT